MQHQVRKHILLEKYLIKNLKQCLSRAIKMLHFAKNCMKILLYIKLWVDELFTY